MQKETMVNHSTSVQIKCAKFEQSNTKIILYSNKIMIIILVSSIYLASSLMSWQFAIQNYSEIQQFEIRK